MKELKNRFYSIVYNSSGEYKNKDSTIYTFAIDE